MVTSSAEIVAFLQEMQLFQSLDEEQLIRVATRLKEFKLSKGQLLFSQGDRGENFYILLGGLARVWRMEYRQEIDIAILEPGDSFGEEELLYYEPRIASITALEDTTLLYLDNHDFEWLLNNFADIKPNLETVAETHQRSRKMNFEWVGEGEVIHLISQRHVAHLLFNLLRPTALLLPGALALTFILFAPTMATQLFASIFSGLLLAASILWAIWYIIDWRNDYFVVTNQRVVWLEQVILQSASRVDAPLSAIQSVNTKTSLLGRTFDYGNVIVRTFTGRMVMVNVRSPKLMKGHIEELILRARKKSQQSKLETIRYSIRQSLGHEVDPEFAPPAQPLPSPPPQPNSSGLSLFKTRQVDGDTFTYRKHWFDLLYKTWPVVVFALGILIAASGLVWRNLITAAYPPNSTTLLIGLFAIVIPILSLIYHYFDWRNDLYLVSSDSIVDREKKPLGTEITKSAPLKNVLSLDHKKRGILGILFNFGDVNINVGDAALTFHNVANPAQVQQDIFYRMEKLKRTEVFSKEEEERERMTEWIKTYHELKETKENPAQP
jgi:CRP-like cAMP-binding protein